MNFPEAWLEELPVILCPVLDLEYGFKWEVRSKLNTRCGGGGVFIVAVCVVHSTEN